MTGPLLQVMVMGVSSTGKSTVGSAVATHFGWDFLEGDDLHPASNIAKMKAGEALDDDDRTPWLDRVSDRAVEQSSQGRSSVLTCSALKRAYRDRLRRGVPDMYFVHLSAPYEVLEPRMAQRDRHFMPTSLLRSQLDTLEPLGDDEDGVTVDVSGPLESVVTAAQHAVEERLRAS